MSISYNDANSVGFEVVNTDTNNLGKSTVIIGGKDTTAFLVADKTFDIRSTTNVTLTPDYGNASGSALEAFANGDVSITGNVTAPNLYSKT